MINSGMMTSNTVEWWTPSWLVETIVRILGEIELDPSADEGHRIPANHHYTEHGLFRNWGHTTFCNPPYGKELGAWVAKAAEEVDAGNVSSLILLLPARTDTRWWARIAGWPVCFIQKRLVFDSPDPDYKPTSAPFPSALVYTGPRLDVFRRECGKIGHCYMPSGGCA